MHGTRIFASGMPYNVSFVLASNSWLNLNTAAVWVSWQSENTSQYCTSCTGACTAVSRALQTSTWDSEFAVTVNLNSVHSERSFVVMAWLKQIKKNFVIIFFLIYIIQRETSQPLYSVDLILPLKGQHVVILHVLQSCSVSIFGIFTFFFLIMWKNYVNGPVISV